MHCKWVGTYLHHYTVYNVYIISYNYYVFVGRRYCTRTINVYIISNYILYLEIVLLIFISILTYLYSRGEIARLFCLALYSLQ